MQLAGIEVGLSIPKKGRFYWAHLIKQGFQE
jgi:hypothetical protein